MEKYNEIKLLFLLTIFVLCFYIAIKLKNIETSINEMAKEVYVEIEDNNETKKEC